jgi:ribosomal protein S18 acetylase RimI-like enzyme
MATIGHYVKKGFRRLPRFIGRVISGLTSTKPESLKPDEMVIGPMTPADIDRILETFSVWGKSRVQYERYLCEQNQNERVVLVAKNRDNVVGYGTLIWESPHGPLNERHIPEILDLNVISKYQGQGIGSALISAAEQEVTSRGGPLIGISVEQTPQYAAANRLYPKLGYEAVGRTETKNLLHLMKTL